MFKPAGFLQVSLLALLSACAAAPTPPQAADPSSGVRSTSAPASQEAAQEAVTHTLDGDEQAYAKQVALSRQIPLGHVQQRLSQARYNARVAELIAPAKTTRIRRSWTVYRQRVVEPIRIRAGLDGSVPDAVASVANFLIEHGWQKGLPVFAPVNLPANAGTLVVGGLTPTLNWQALQDAGATSRSNSNSAWQRQPLGVIDLVEESRKSAEYRTATPNFFAITQYNRSYFYAASVADLAAALESARAGQARK